MDMHPADPQLQDLDWQVGSSIICVLEANFGLCNPNIRFKGCSRSATYTYPSKAKPHIDDYLLCTGAIGDESLPKKIWEIGLRAWKHSSLTRGIVLSIGTIVQLEFESSCCRKAETYQPIVLVTGFCKRWSSSNTDFGLDDRCILWSMSHGQEDSIMQVSIWTIVWLARLQRTGKIKPIICRTKAQKMLACPKSIKLYIC